LSDPFNSSVDIFSEEDFQNIYVLESAQNRVVVLTPEGEFVREFRSGSLASTSSLLVSEDEQTAYAVGGSEIFELSLVVTQE